MKKKVGIGISVIAALLIAGTALSKKYDCYRYVKGKPTGSFIVVEASDKSEATYKAIKKMKKLGDPVDGANCRSKY